MTVEQLTILNRLLIAFQDAMDDALQEELFAPEEMGDAAQALADATLHGLVLP